MNINKQKELWEALAKKNPRYYINTDKGRGISESEFRQSGKANYQKLIAEDQLLKGKESILDFGCGIGRLTEFMARDFRTVIGIDISGTMIKLAKERLKNLGNIKLIETNGSVVPLPDNSVDVAFSYLVFQHQKERETVEKSFADIARVLTPGGIFKVLLRSDKTRDLNRWWGGVEYSQEATKKLSEKSGFNILKIEPVDQYAFWVWLKKMDSLYNSKWEKGKANTLHFYRLKLPWKAATFNQILSLPDYFGPMIGSKKEVTIADLGAGMFCTIGSLWKTAKVKVYASDALSVEFNQLLKNAGVTPLIPVTKENMENLTYKDNFFDIVHCVNALDHTANPLKALQEMYRVVKPGGYIYLRHFVNVGESERYSGLHIWNIDMDDKNECILWNQDNKFLLSDLFKGFKTIKKRELDYEMEDMVVSILHKKWGKT